MDIAKITKVEDLQKVLDAYKLLIGNPQAIVSQKNEFKSKIEFFVNKYAVWLNKEALKKPEEKLPQFLDFLLLIDKELPYKDFFDTHGLEWFSNIFKFTFYSNKFAVINHEGAGFLKLEVLDHQVVIDKLISDTSLKNEDKVNFVVNNLLNKMLFTFNKQNMLVHSAELLFSQDKLISIKKIAKLLVYFGKLFELAPHKRCKYLQGSLFAIGALLKIEAKSYLKTKTERSENFNLVCPLIDDQNEIDKLEQQRMRIMIDDDIDYFETEFIDIILEFIRTIVVPVKGVLTHTNFNYYIDFGNPKMLDEYEEEEQKNPDKLYAVESAHYTIEFLFDLIQFSFQYLVKADEVQRSSVKQEQEEAKDQRLRNTFDHRKPIEPSDLILLHFTYYIKRYEEIISEALQSISSVSKNSLILLWYWHIKNADDPRQWDKMDEARDSYDRSDNYNVFGLSSYIYLHFLSQIATITQNEKIVQSKEMHFYQLKESFYPFSKEFILEALLNFFYYNLRSKSTTLQQFGLQTLGYWVYLTQGDVKYNELGHFNKDEQAPQFLIQSIFNYMGSLKVTQPQQRLCMKVIRQLLNLYAPVPRLRIYNYIFEILDDDKNDRGISILISSFYKEDCEKNPKEFLEKTKEIFDQTLDSLKEDTFILDVSERIHASLNLYMYLAKRENIWVQNGQIEKPIISDTLYKDQINKKYFEPMNRTIGAGMETVEEDKKKLVEQTSDEIAREGMMQSINQRMSMLETLRFLLSEAIKA